MVAEVRLVDGARRVVPGEELVLSARITNVGEQSDELTLTLVGRAASWGEVVVPTGSGGRRGDDGGSPSVYLLPGRSADVEVVLRPGRRSDVLAGEWPLGLRATSDAGSHDSVVDETVVHVQPFLDLRAELLPATRTTRGLRTRRYDLRIDNRGNDDETAVVDAVDRDEKLALALDDKRVRCPPGRATVVPLYARARDRYWIGTPRHLGFAAVVSPRGPEPLAPLDGTLVHVAAVPPGLPKAVLRAVAVAVAAVLLLLFVVEPRLEKQAAQVARESVGDQVSPAKDQAQQAADAAQKAKADAAAAAGAAKDAAPGGKDGAPAIRDPKTGKLLPDVGPRPYTARLAVRAGGYGPSLKVPVTEEVSLAGFVLQPNGDRGEATLLRSGEVLVTLRMGAAQVFDLPAPVIFPPGSSLQLTVLCRNPAGTPCTAAVLLTGTVRTVPAPAEPDPGPTVRAPAPVPQPAPSEEPLPS